MYIAHCFITRTFLKRCTHFLQCLKTILCQNGSDSQLNWTKKQAHVQNVFFLLFMLAKICLKFPKVLFYYIVYGSTDRKKKKCITNFNGFRLSPLQLLVNHCWTTQAWITRSHTQKRCVLVLCIHSGYFKWDTFWQFQSRADMSAILRAMTFFALTPQFTSEIMLKSRK